MAFKIPKTIGACADLLYQTRQKRLDAQKVVDALQAEETALKNHIIDTLPKSEATGAAGKLCRVSVVKKEAPQVEDWDKFYAYVKKTGQFDLMQKRLADSAIKERWNDGKKIPGVKVNSYVTVSINKI